MVTAFDGSHAADLPPATRDLVRRGGAALGGAYRLFYASPCTLVRGSGVYLYDAAGNAYLDAYNNVPSVGHSHPHVTEAVTRQLGTLNTHTRYLTEGVVGYAERLLAAHDLERRPRTRCSPAPAARRTTSRCGSPGTTPARPG